MNVFERHPRVTVVALLLLLSMAALVFTEWSAKTFFGLGQVVLYEAHPIYGYRPQPQQTVARQKNQVIHINNLGLRADMDWDPYQPLHKILFLGDSVTYGGSYISNDQLFSHLAVQPFSTWQSANAGVNGWGVSNVAAFIQHTAFLPADIYVSVFPEGDFYRGINRIGGQPFWTRPPRYALEELLQYGIYLLHLRKTPVIYFEGGQHPDSTLIAEQAVRDLKQLDAYLSAHHKQHIIYITPSREQVLHRADKDRIVYHLLKKYDLQVSYILDQLPDVSPPHQAVWFHDSIHLTPLGHAMWATVIHRDLAERIPT